MPKRKVFYLVLLVVILLAAFVIRFYNIENVPNSIYRDEAANGVDALDALHTGEYELFYANNNGREGLFINLIALSFHFFGVTILGLKFPSIIFGVLSVLGTYLVTKELFKSQKVGLIAAFFMAFSFWSINFSRIAFRAIMLPAVLTFSFYYILLGIESIKKYKITSKNKRLLQNISLKTYLYFALAGLIFGIGLHTYIAFRITPVILIILFVALWISEKNFLRRYIGPILIFVIFSFFTMAPMLVDFYQHPEFIISRSGNVSVFSPEMNNGNAFLTLTKSIGLSLIKYNFWGDQNWRHSYPPYPILNPIVGIFFLIGLVYLIRKWFQLLFSRFKHKVREQNFYIYSFILAWFFVMLAPEFFTAEGLPHALRSIGTMPVIYIIATIPFVWLFRNMNKPNIKYKILSLTLIVVSITLVGFFNTTKYHYFWAKNPIQADAFDSDLMNISNYLKTIPTNKQIIVIADDKVEKAPIQLFNYGNPNISYIDRNKLDEFISKKDDHDKDIIIPAGKHEWVVEKITNAYPEIKLRTVKNESIRNGEVWVIHQ